MGEILLIDEQPSVRLVLGDALRDAGHTVSVAAEGHAGLALARARRFDAVVTNIRLPGIDGIPSSTGCAWSRRSGGPSCRRPHPVAMPGALCRRPELERGHRPSLAAGPRSSAEPAA